MQQTYQTHLLQELHRKARRERVRRVIHRWAGVAFVSFSMILIYQTGVLLYRVLF